MPPNRTQTQRKRAGDVTFNQGKIDYNGLAGTGEKIPGPSPLLPSHGGMPHN